VSTDDIFSIPVVLVEEAVRASLREDLGRAGDITTQATIPASASATAHFVARTGGVVAGVTIAEAAFAALDRSIQFEIVRADGKHIAAGDTIARVSGPARPILSAERVALNYLSHLSGIATATADLVAAVEHTSAKVTCTRKTTPGLRGLEKFAVRCGGGSNHRFGLDDAILIKDNHIAVAGGVARAIVSAREFAGHTVKIEVEVTTQDELAEAMSAGPDIVMLDNMTPDQIRAAVSFVSGRATTEASGNVTLATIAGIAEAGVDYISSGWITHSAPALDIGLDVVIDG